MKKILLITLLFSSIVTYSQDENRTPTNEIKIDVSQSLLKGSPALSYERILGRLSTAGVYIKYHIENSLVSYNNEDNHQIFRNFVIPYYRVYFNDKNGTATGTFIEGNCAFYSIDVKNNEEYYEFYNDGNENNYFKEKKVNIGVGIAIGKKWKTQSDWVIEFNLGLGRNLSYNKYNYYYGTSYNADVIMFYPRGDLSIGKRF